MRTLPDKTRIVQLAHSTVEVDEAGEYDLWGVRSA